MTVRKATHSGSWYSSDATVLSSRLKTAIQASKIKPAKTNLAALLVPHAGYSYSANTAAFSYASINTAAIQTIFILGPSHHVFIKGCRLSSALHYDTPFGSLSIDTNIVAELSLNTNLFKHKMSLKIDEAEHSIEMQLPFIKHIFDTMDGNVQIVSVLVGEIDEQGGKDYAVAFEKYFANPSCLFVISSDFCHWGRRFNYQSNFYPDIPVYKSITKLDHDALDIIKLLDPFKFSDYLVRTKNTICGRNPILLLLYLINLYGKQVDVEVLNYDQSSKVVDMGDSSVSYVSARFLF